MENYFFIKYYYTCFNSTQLFQDLQLQVENKLETIYKNDNLKVYLQFIDATDNAYFNDTCEIMHTIDLDLENKKTISSILRDLIYFYNESDEEAVELIADSLEPNHHLNHVIFRKIDSENIINLDN